MVDDRKSLRWNDLNTLDVPIFSQTGVDENVRPLIGGPGRHDKVLWQRDDAIGLADRVLVEKNSLLSYCKRSISPIELAAAAVRVGGLDDRGADMVDDRVSFGRNDLNTLDVPIFLQTWIDKNIRPLIGSFGFHDKVLWQAYDEIRRPDVP